MDESTKNSPCKECKDGADEVQLQSEVEHLRQHLSERDAHIVAVEAEFIKCTSRLQDFEEQVSTWREKYERLYDSHKRVQKLNQVLEEKLLQMVDKMKGEKSQLTKDIATLSVRLAEAKYNCGMLQKENERYKNDMNLAIQLLQCKPDNFVAQKLDNLPSDTQARVSQYVMSKTSKPSGSVQSKGSNVNEIDNFDTSEYEFNISASLMSKILEDSIQDTVTKHCDTCTCNKSQNKPFCYNDSQYTVSTQTNLSGEMKNSLCINCNTEIKSIHSNISMKSNSPHGIKVINEKMTGLIPGPLYIMPQQHPVKQCNVNYDKIDLNKILINDHIETINNLEKNNVLDTFNEDTNSKIADVNMSHRKLTVMSMEPAVHHKLCDRTKTSISSKNSITSVHNEDMLIKEIVPPNDSKPKQTVQSADSVSLRKNSQSSMGAVSRTSSLAKSSVSNQKYNTQVGPGPRFCHLRMQAGSKNILLDNAQPDVPPVLYRRQSKCNENPIFKDLNDGMDDFIDFNKTDTLITMEDKSSNVVESTLIDVHVDNHVKESNEVSDCNTPINPVLLNVSSSPLQPLKTHNFLNTSENNNYKPHNTEHTPTNFENDNLINNFNLDINKNSNNNHQLNKYPFSPTDSHDIKIFNFDRYEQKIASQFNKSLKKIDMSQLHSLENTKISKDLPPQGELPKLDKMSDAPSKVIPAIVNVYPNLSQTHLKANDKLTNEKSTSSLSSDDSAAVLQKQQLLRVAEWVEKNLEQQNSFKEPLDEDVNFSNRAARRDSKLSRLTETLNELALNMPHPVSKYSKSYTKDAHVPNNWIHNNVSLQKQTLDEKPMKLTQKLTPNIVKETIFPVECGDAAYTEVTTEARIVRRSSKDACKELREVFKSDSDKEISPEELARMEYNVKRFLLSGPQWITPESGGRSRRTSSKTETDV